MNLEQDLQKRSASQCELCGSSDNLGIFEVSPHTALTIDSCILICDYCLDQIRHPEKLEVNHWRCLNDSMWSQIPAVQVMAWRMLKRLNSESWSQDLLEMLYLDDDTLAWAQSGVEPSDDTNTIKHIDSNGNILNTGDTVTLIKDLVVKGAGFTAKRGTAVRGIFLDANNENYIEGRVNNQKIVILTKYVKK